MPKITVQPELVYLDSDYADVCTYVETAGGDWKVTTSKDRHTKDVYETIEYADSDECFDETDKEMPADVRALFDSVHPVALEILSKI